MAAPSLSCSLIVALALVCCGIALTLSSASLLPAHLPPPHLTATLPLRQHLRRSASSRSTFLPQRVRGLQVDREFLVDLSLGTPPQTIPLILDTGSDAVWVPCTSHFTCTSDCPDTGSSRPIFSPNLSSSSHNISLHSSTCQTLSSSCSLLSPNRAGHCFYFCSYGTGNTTGFLQRDTLSLILQNGGTKRISQFVYGCSIHSGFNPVGIVGFGQGSVSLPSQLGTLIQNKFAYCFPSHAFDDTKTKGYLFLGETAVAKGPGVKHTPLVSNPEKYPTYYYVDLEGISIGGKRLNASKSLFQLDARGEGGTIFDSGTGFTRLQPTVYQLAIQELKARIEYPRSTLLEAAFGLGLCYNLSSIPNASKAEFPSFIFHFKGADMYLPTENYFFDFTGYNLPCFAMQNINNLENIGPSGIIGNFQQQNFHVLYDLKHKRLGFSARKCSA